MKSKHFVSIQCFVLFLNFVFLNNRNNFVFLKTTLCSEVFPENDICFFCNFQAYTNCKLWNCGKKYICKVAIHEFWLIIQFLTNSDTLKFCFTSRDCLLPSPEKWNCELHLGFVFKSTLNFKRVEQHARRQILASFRLLDFLSKLSFPP